MSIKVYQGLRLSDGRALVEHVETDDLGRRVGQPRPLDLRLAVLDVEDGVDFFGWGIGDLGPNPGARRLGFALLHDWIGDESRALELLDDFVTLRVLMLPDRVWTMRGVDIENDVARINRARDFGGAARRP